MKDFHPYSVFPLGDSALTINYGNTIDPGINAEVIARYRQLETDPLPAMIEAVPAYSSITIYYDPLQAKKNIPNGTAFEWMKEELEKRLIVPVSQSREEERRIRVPVCYDPAFAPDLQRIAGEKNISIEELIGIHCSTEYKVYMLGFLPGFPYMGQVDDKIITARKPKPENIKAGSVGIAGKQTGIYPLDSPGGWQILGRTPLKLFDPLAEDPVFFKPGDRVQFYSISVSEFNRNA